MKLWKTLCIGMMMLIAVQPAKANEPFCQSYDRNEFAVSFGTWPMRPNIIFNRDDESSDRFSPFDITAEYLFHATKRLSFGVNLTYIAVFDDSFDHNSHNSYSRHNAFSRGNSSYDESILVVMPTIRMEWVKARKFSLYSRLALGVGFEFDKLTDETHTGFTFQAVPFGVTIGEKVYARLEFPAFGYQGLFTAGVGYRF